MRMTVESSDPLLPEALEMAAREGVTWRALIERGLHRVITEAKPSAPFKLRRASFKGKGLMPELRDPSWAHLHGLTYEGRGS